MFRPAVLCLATALAVTAWSFWPKSGVAVTSGKPAPEITAEHWINSKPLTIDGLKGRVVLVEFWTYGCINCRNIIPHLRGWHDKYEVMGLTIVGVHSPEFFWEKPLDKVKAAALRLGIKFPVAQDNGFEIWRRYGVRAWPTIVLVDKQGIIRYSHIGEGAYEKTESVINGLLAEQS